MIIKGQCTSADIFTDNIEDAALQWIKAQCDHPAFEGVRIVQMPDVHAGNACNVGTAYRIGAYLNPDHVGVDIGCAISMHRLSSVVAPEDFALLDHKIREAIPTGMEICKKNSLNEKELFRFLNSQYRKARSSAPELINEVPRIDARFVSDFCRRIKLQEVVFYKSLGTLGGGNHFIELDKDDDGNVYLVIHTGSRNLGKQVAEIYQAKAVKHLTAGADEFEETIKRTIEEYKTAGRRSELQGVIKKMRREHEAAEPSLPADLCYVEGEAREHYLHDMRICQRWAVLNRKLISLLLMRFFPDVAVLEEFESVHNYISDENIIRKGSISAAVGERCIIPLNMRDGSLLCTGRGNPDWNYSAPHGAGRVLSRTQAYEKITMEDFEASMQGIYSESVNDFTRDESPMVYKPASEIIANIGNTVTIDTIIRPIFNFKAS